MPYKPHKQLWLARNSSSLEVQALDYEARAQELLKGANLLDISQLEFGYEVADEIIDIIVEYIKNEHQLDFIKNWSFDKIWRLLQAAKSIGLKCLIQSCMSSLEKEEDQLEILIKKPYTYERDSFRVRVKKDVILLDSNGMIELVHYESCLMNRLLVDPRQGVVINRRAFVEFKLIGWFVDYVLPHVDRNNFNFYYCHEQYQEHKRKQTEAQDALACDQNWLMKFYKPGRDFVVRIGYPWSVTRIFLLINTIMILDQLFEDDEATITRLGRILEDKLKVESSMNGVDAGEDDIIN